MDKKDIYFQVSNIEEQMGKLFEDMASLKKKLVLLLEENKRLSIENEQLRRILKKSDGSPNVDNLPTESQNEAVDVQVPGAGHDNLARLYMEGFHICNVYYGHLRTEGDCLFCLSFLNK